MLIRHATPKKNLPGIQKAGLLTSKSRGKLPVIWFHTAGKSAWAVLHVAARHKCRVEGTAVLEVEVPRAWLRRRARRVWTSARDVPPSRIRRVISFTELAGQPA